MNSAISSLIRHETKHEMGSIPLEVLFSPGMNGAVLQKRVSGKNGAISPQLDSGMKWHQICKPGTSQI